MYVCLSCRALAKREVTQRAGVFFVGGLTGGYGETRNVLYTSAVPLDLVAIF